MPAIAAVDLVNRLEEAEKVFLWVQGFFNRGAWIEQDAITLIKISQDRLGKEWVLKADVRWMEGEMWIIPYGSMTANAREDPMYLERRRR